jgi:hypothetical protein
MTEAQLNKHAERLTRTVLAAYENYDEKGKDTLTGTIEMFAETALKKKYDFQWRLIIREIDEAESLHMKELAELQGTSDPCKGFYDPMGVHQEIIDKLRALREQAQKQLGDEL